LRMYVGDQLSEEANEVLEEEKQKTTFTAPLLGEVQLPNVDLESKKTWLRKKLDKAWSYLQQEWPKVLIFTLWMIINVLLWFENAIVYFNNPNMFVTVAHGFGQVLNFNCALILVPVLRNLLTVLRGTFLHYVIPFDANIVFHRRIAWFIVIASIGHFVAHYFNYLVSGIPYQLGYMTLAGITGHLLVIVMVLMYSSALESVKRPYYNVFYFTHHLFIVWFILLLLHGPRYWRWFLMPGIIYTFERIIREWRGKQTHRIVRVINHPSDTVELQIEKKNFKYKAGQYLYLSCPYISFYEWHPFTISSAPHEETVNIHIRCVGRWTKKIRELLAPKELGELEFNKAFGPDGLPLLRVDGAYGAASEEVFNYRAIVLVGAGIGVTPFASVLKAIVHRKQNDQHCKVEKAYFFWVCRETTSFEWFQDMLREMELEMRRTGDNFLEINVHLTQRLKTEQIREIVADQGTLDPLTALESKTQYGRPNFDALFPIWKERHTGSSILRRWAAAICLLLLLLL